MGCEAHARHGNVNYAAVRHVYVHAVVCRICMEPHLTTVEEEAELRQAWNVLITIRKYNCGAHLWLVLKIQKDSDQVRHVANSNRVAHNRDWGLLSDLIPKRCQIDVLATTDRGSWLLHSPIQKNT